METAKHDGGDRTIPLGKPYSIRFRLKTFSVSDRHGDYGGGMKLNRSANVALCARSILGTLDADKEHFVVLCLNNRNKLTGFKVTGSGTLTSAFASSRDVCIAALELRAAAVIFAHNHPSGDPTPGDQDIQTTRDLKKCMEMIGIRAVDHVIVSRDRYYSFADKEVVFGEIPSPKRRAR